ncbi:MAG: dTDP-4-dehydrorhamnose reductase [Clostridiales Family XIII bacterium]|jgi:dTDP-4-dehydrorhamnose reductase|nr:dTDP-4-dehydrorhamnose reductase [Clostridiales Family XIII bacterium]
MKILITGGNGQLGNELKDILAVGKSEIGEIPDVYKNSHVTSIDIEDVDLSDADAAEIFFADKTFDIIINCAAMTNVDACESDPDSAMKGNALAPRNLAIFAGRVGAKILHVSTDYVFSGDATEPYSEWTLPAPNTAYGKSKLLGERYVTEAQPKSFIVRTAWLYGRQGKNFVKTMISLSENHDSIKVVSDQFGNPTNANDLAHHILKIAATNEFGIYHCTGKGICSWYDFASEIIGLSGNDCKVNPCTTEEYGAPAPRPAYSAMEHLMLSVTVGDEMRDWKEALRTYMDALRG